MLGHKTFTPRLFYRFSLEAQIPEDHLLRRVAAAVDCGFVRRLTARFYSHTGRPGIDPEEVRLHLASRWFLGYDLDEATPDHSVLSKARARFGLPVYQAFFTEVVRQCERAGLVRGDELYVDSTLVQANAGLSSAGARALVAQLPGAAGYIEAVWQENPEPAASTGHTEAPSEPATGTPPPGPHAGAETSGCGLHVAGPADVPNGTQGLVNELVVSRTDPDAGLVRREGVPSGFYHKVHLGVDGGRARVITAVEVTPGEVADEHLLDRLRKEHTGTTGRTVTEIVADTKYGTHANYTQLEQQGIRACIPPHRKPHARGAFTGDRFVYDAAADRYRCPAGQDLTRHGYVRTTTTGTEGGIIYRAKPQACGACPLKPACCGAAAVRTLTRPNDGGLRDRVVAYLRTRRGRRRMRRRSAWVETANAELKDRHGLRRAQFRGRDRVLIQALGAAGAYDVKKLAQLCGPGPATQGIAVAARTERSGGSGAGPEVRKTPRPRPCAWIGGRERERVRTQPRRCRHY